MAMSKPRSGLLVAWLVAGCIGITVFSASGATSVDGRASQPDKRERRRSKALQKELESPYKKWVEEEVPYIITDVERAAFKNLSTDEEREQFVQHFWDIRNP